MLFTLWCYPYRYPSNLGNSTKYGLSMGCHYVNQMD